MPMPAQDPTKTLTTALRLPALSPVLERRTFQLARTHPAAMPIPAWFQAKNPFVWYQPHVPKQDPASLSHAAPC